MANGGSHLVSLKQDRATNIVHFSESAFPRSKVTLRGLVPNKKPRLMGITGALMRQAEAWAGR